MADENTPKLFTVEEASAVLKISSRTLRRYMSLGIVEFSVLNPVAERRYARFSTQQLEDFLARNKRGMTTPERPKRVYNRRVVKHQRRKKKAA